MSYDEVTDRLLAEIRRGEPGPMDPRQAVSRGRARTRRRHLTVGVATLALVVCGAAATASVLTAAEEGRATDPAGQQGDPTDDATPSPTTPPVLPRALDELVPAVLGEALPPGPSLPVSHRATDDVVHGLTWGAIDGAEPDARSVAVMVQDFGQGGSFANLGFATGTCEYELDHEYSLTCTATELGDAAITIRTAVARDAGSTSTGWPAWLTSPPTVTASIAEHDPETLWYLHTVTMDRADGIRVTVEERVHAAKAADAAELFRITEQQLVELASEVSS